MSSDDRRRAIGKVTSVAADRFVIDFMLAHVPKDETESAYNRAKYLRRRAELAQIWAYLITTTLRPAGDLLSMPRR